MVRLIACRPWRGLFREDDVEEEEEVAVLFPFSGWLATVHVDGELGDERRISLGNTQRRWRRKKEAARRGRSKLRADRWGAPVRVVHGDGFTRYGGRRRRGKEEGARVAYLFGKGPHGLQGKLGHRLG